MAIDRTQVRRRVRTITGWAAAAQNDIPPAPDPYQQVPQDQHGFAPPSASTGPPQSMSGGS